MLEKVFKLRENHTTSENRDSGGDYHIYDHGIYSCCDIQMY